MLKKATLNNHRIIKYNYGIIEYKTNLILIHRNKNLADENGWLLIIRKIKWNRIKSKCKRNDNQRLSLDTTMFCKSESCHRKIHSKSVFCSLVWISNPFVLSTLAKLKTILLIPPYMVYYTILYFFHSAFIAPAKKKGWEWLLWGIQGAHISWF